MEKVRNWAKMQQKNAKKPPNVEDFVQNRLFFVTKSGGLEVYSEQNPPFWEESAWQSQVHDSQECMTWRWRVHDSHKNNNNNKKKKLWFWTIFSLAAFNSSKSCSSWILLCRRYLFLFEVQISISRNTYKKQLKIFFEHFWLQYNIKLLHTYIFSHVILYSCIKPGCPGQKNI